MTALFARSCRDMFSWLKSPSKAEAVSPTLRLQSAALAFLSVSLLTGSAFAAGPTFSESLAQRPLYLGAASFAAGFLASLTPCVYPMIAITVSVFGASKAKSKLQAFALSGAFLIGLAAMFVPLGVVAAVTGKTFGSVLSNVWVNGGLALFFLVLAASMFGAFDLDLPAAWKQKLATAGGTGYLGAFVLGLACGPIAAPCTGPFLYGLLAFIAKSQSIPLGSASMTAFALGLGLPFFVVGAFAMQLPKSGRWMVHVKSIAGIILVVVALYFLGNSFEGLRSWASPSVPFLVAMAALVLVGVLLGAVHKSFDAAEWSVRVAKGAGVVLVCFASFGFVSGVMTPDRFLTFEKPVEGEDLEQLIARAAKLAKDEGRPMFMDFTASWCAACKEIERDTFPDEHVQKAAGRFISVKLDMSDASDPAVERTFSRYEVRGLPTLILVDSSGHEVKRFFGDFVPPEELVAAMEAVN